MAIGSIGLLGRLGALVSQPAVQAVVAGALTGAVGGTALIGTGVIPIGGSQQSAPTLALVSCPGSSTILGQVTSGQPLLVTARSRDGQWLQVYIGAPGLNRAWAPATSVSLQSSGDALPVADCTLTARAATPLATIAAVPSPAPTPAVSAVASPSAGPTPSATAVPTAPPTLAPGQTPSPTPKPTPTTKPTAPPTLPPTAPPTAPPTPVPTKDTTPPSITNVAISGAYYDGSQYYIGPSGNGCYPSSATISASITDAGGVDGTQTFLYFYEPNTSNLHKQEMGFNLFSHLYSSTITPQSTWQAGFVIQYWIHSADKSGNVTDWYPPSNLTLVEGICIP